MRNRIHRIVSRQHEWKMPQVTDLFSKKGLEALCKAQFPPPDALLLEQNLGLHEMLQQQIQQIEQQIGQEGQTDRAVELLASLPGIGLILSNVIATEIDGIDRFAHSAKLCAYAGLVPSTRSSGDKTYPGRTLAQCNKWLKWAFVEAAWVAIGCSAYFGGQYRQLRDRGKTPNSAIITVAHRMCQIAYRLLKQNRMYEERHVNISPGRS